MASAARAPGNHRPSARDYRPCFSAHSRGLSFSGNGLGRPRGGRASARDCSFDAGFELAPTLRCSMFRYRFLHRSSQSAVVFSLGAMPRLLVDGLRSILISAMSPSLSGTSRRRSSSSRKRPRLRRASSSFRSPLFPGGPKQPRRSGDNRSIAAERAAKYSRSVQGYRPRLPSKRRTRED